jgi:RimJ/RimL family protein N-acetyltransferase
MIATPRLKVRHLDTGDYAAYCQLQGDASVKRFTGGPLSVSEAAYQRFISAPDISCMAVCAKHDGRFVGTCGFRDVDGRIELEIFLLPEVQGQGLGSELFDAMISHCATAFSNAKVGASVSPLNPRAIKLLETRHFQDTGETTMLKSGLKHSVYLKFS